MNLISLLDQACQRHGTEPAIVQGQSRVITFAALNEQSQRAAGWLSGQGIRCGDRVLILQPMGIELYVLLLGLWRLGAVPSFVDPGAASSSVQSAIERIRPVLFVGAPRAHLLRLRHGALRRVPGKVVVGPMGWPGTPRFSPERCAAVNALEAIEDAHPALVTFTSGSGGEPKGIERSHGFLRAQHEALSQALDLRAGQWDLTTLPVFLLANLASGVTSVIADADLRRPGFVHTGRIARQLKRWPIVRSVGSPAFFERLLEQGVNLTGMQRVDTGGAPVFEDLLQRLQRAAPEAAVMCLYGSSEAEPIAEQRWADAPHSPPGNALPETAAPGLLVGYPIERIALRVIEPRWGQPLGPMDESAFEAMTQSREQAGEIVVTGEHVLKHYLDGVGEDQTKMRVDATTWHRTGDVGYVDARGQLWLLGRAEAVIRDGRGTVYPLPVEAAARCVAGVARAGLAEHAGRRWLVVEPARRGGLDVPALRALANGFELDRVARMKALPVDRRQNAKIDYAALRRRLASGRFSAI